MGDDDKSLVYNLNVCRICQIESNLDLINTSTKIQGAEQSYMDVLKFIFNDIIWVEDNLISVACTSCLKKVKDTAEFKRLCWTTNFQRESVHVTFPTKVEIDSCKVESIPDDFSDDAPENNWIDSEEGERPQVQRKKRKRTKISAKVFKIDQFKQKTKFKTKRRKKTYESAKKNKFQCDICKESFDRSDVLARHIFRHDGTRNHICPVCGLKYITHSDLTSHLRLHSGECNYACDVCPKKFKTSSCLKAHKSVVHIDAKDYKYECTDCGRKFSTGAVLRVHKKRHNQIRNFPCDLCEKKFISKDEQLRHVTVHTNVKAFKCDLCPAEYTRNQYLKVHKRKEHGDLKKEKVKKLYKCVYCDKSIDFKDKAKHFVRAHGDIKPYQCRQCDAKFVLKTYTKLHLRKVHNIYCNMRKGFEEYVIYQIPQKDKNDQFV